MCVLRIKLVGSGILYKSCIGEEYTMSTRDIGKHVVELHTHGMLDITGEGVRISLSAHEALDLLQWLDNQREVLLQAVKESPTEAEVPAWMRVATEQSTGPTEEQEIAVDEP
jgi:hypothetical protein